MKPKREIVEENLLEQFREIRPHIPSRDHQAISHYKDGTFGLSSLGFALYSNGHSLRGQSKTRPYGLIFESEDTMFSIGYYRKEQDSAESDGHVFIVAPRGDKVIEEVKRLTKSVLNSSLPCRGVYARFLTVDQYKQLLSDGFLPAKEAPWHEDSPEEDETLTSSLVRLEDIVDSQSQIRVLPYGSRNSRKKSRMTYQRFRNFLDKNCLEYDLRDFSAENSEVAKRIIQDHFDTLREEGNQIGSIPEDHFNSCDSEIIKLPSVITQIGYLGNLPVSYFSGEIVSDSRLALYTPFTLRSPELVLPKIGKDVKAKEGFSAISMFAYLELLRKLKDKGIKEVLFGGSEHRDLNRIKRQFGCRNDPSYWAVKLKT
ncbi:MAG: hypothetical protein AABW73_01365 [Nanoarchaeota archaeon]